MSLATPLALALGSLAIPIILLYMLRLRRREQVVSSTLLWQELARDQSANAPWQKLRRNIFILLQLLVLAALVLALAQPYLLSTDAINGHVFILLDASASMTSSDGEDGMSRFDEATAIINQMAANMGGNDRLTVITVSDAPAVVVASTNDRELLTSTLKATRPKLTHADWNGAIALVNGTSRGARDTRITIISDGGLPSDLPPLVGEIEYIPVGRASDNLAISVLGSREHADQGELLVGVANYGSSDQTAILSVYLDDQLHDSRQVVIRAGDEESLNWDIPLDIDVVEARISPISEGEDYLSVDNQAWSLLGGTTNTTVKLVSEGNQFLERFLNILPGYEVTRTPDFAIENTADEQPYDLYIFDGVAIPSPLPSGNILIIDPQPAEVPSRTIPQISVSDVFTNTLMTRMANDPRLRDVAWGDVNIAQARQVQGTGLETLIESDGGPLLLAGSIDGRRIAVFPFDLANSDLPLRIAFPVIMANITEWLHAGGSTRSIGNIQPGEVVPLPQHPRTETLRVDLPNGDVWTQRNSGGSEPVLFDQTTQPGLYTIAFYDDAGDLVKSGQFAVNFIDPRESQITPSETIRLGENEVLSEYEETNGMQELWAIVLGVGLLLIAIEWWLAYDHRLNRLLSKAR